jgi:hypothetical protein
MSTAKTATIPRAAHMFQAKLELSGTAHSPLNMLREKPGATKAAVTQAKKPGWRLLRKVAETRRVITAQD